jgi:hypothetical protein
MKDDAKQQLKTVHLGDHAKVLFETDKMDMVRSISLSGLFGLSNKSSFRWAMLASSDPTLPIARRKFLM